MPFAGGMSEQLLMAALRDLKTEAHFLIALADLAGEAETALTVHLLVPEGYPGDAYTAQLAAALKERFEIDHATIQIETDPDADCPLEPDHVV